MMKNRVFTIGEWNVTACLEESLYFIDPAFIPPLVFAYTVGSHGFTNDYDAISQAFTD